MNKYKNKKKYLKKFYLCKKQIVNFFEDKNISCKLSEQNFCRKAAFLCDVMSKQNQLNVSLHGETKSIHDKWQKIDAF